MKIVVASGKGGTGKTTIATSLALAVGGLVTFLDCDVEAPNAHLFLHPKQWDWQKEVGIPIPQIDRSRCTLCGHCVDVCQFNALAIAGDNVLVFQELCHGCGSCTAQCPEAAISETPNIIGTIEGGLASNGIHFSRGLLNVGQPMAVPIIRQLKAWNTAGEVQNGTDANSSALTILDSPPGTSCPVVETVRSADAAVLVTEPTPFGLHDLKLMYQVVEELQIPSGVVINRAGIGSAPVESFCHKSDIPILMRVPFKRSISEGIAAGKTLIEVEPGMAEQFELLLAKLKQLAGTNNS